MGMFQRVADVIRAKVNRLLDRAEDPRDTLDLSYSKQIESLQQIRRSVAEVATARKRIEMQAAQLQQQATKLQDQARQALSQGQEGLAREALERRSAIASELADLQGQHGQISAQEQKLVETAHRLQSQVETFRTRKETLKATYTAAEAQSKIGEAAAGISDSMGNAGLAMQRAQDKITNMQARAGAIDELLESGALTDMTVSTDDIQARLDKVASSTQVEAELAQLRAELSAAPGSELNTASKDPETDTEPNPAAVPDHPEVST